MKLRRSTWVWTLLFVAGVVAAIVSHNLRGESSCLNAIPVLLILVSGFVLLIRGVVLAVRAIVRRLTLRLAFSYFLIGIVPIPLLACLLFIGAYLVAHQIVATRVYAQSVELARQEAASDRTAPGFRVDGTGKVVASDVPWIAIDSDAPWVSKLDRPRPVIEGDRGWLAVRAPDRIVLILLSDPEKSWARRLSQVTGYEVSIEAGRSRSGRRGVTIDIDPDDRPPAPAVTKPPFPDPVRTAAAGLTKAAVRSAQPDAPSPGLLDRKWVAGVYIDAAVATFSRSGPGRQVVIYIGRTSPRALFDQLFAQGVPDVGRVFWGVFAGVAGLILIVYLCALAIAFTLVGTIARNVNRLTRASEAISRGDFSVRVRSRSKDQIGDLARSFDGMAESIESLLVDTAKKERLEAEIEVARTIQQKLLPGPEAELPGFSVRARFQPLAAIGGDYYDYGPLGGRRSMVAIGDVSGHGLPTGLLVAMAKAGLWTLLESGHQGTGLFVKLNELMHRSTDSRNYMTLALFAYDAETRSGRLTNAGQLAPYRITGTSVESLSLPSFPLGISARSDFPTRDWTLAAGDRIVFVTDGLIEASNPAGEPFGFERFESLLRAEAGSPAIRLEEAILEAIDTHTDGAPAEDDRTLVILVLE